MIFGPMFGPDFVEKLDFRIGKLLARGHLFQLHVVVAWAFSTVPPLRRKVVIPVARNVWLQIFDERPAALARRVIIAKASFRFNR